MKVLVTGANGQLAYDIIRVLNSQTELLALSREQLDITRMDDVLRVVKTFRPTVIINAAGYTDVDGAEVNPDKAFQVNTFGARNVAVAAESLAAKIVYFSTDYVFDGTKEIYTEFDNPAPLNKYGMSKFAGEKLVATLCRRYFIIRTAWMFGSAGTNFIRKILLRYKEQGKIYVVNDQFGSPTYSLDLANFILKLIKTDLYGIYHATNTGKCTWYEFAQAVFEELKMDKDNIVPITSDKLNRLALRPARAIMDQMAIRLNGFDGFRPWKEALKEFIRENLLWA